MSGLIDCQQNRTRRRGGGGAGQRGAGPARMMFEAVMTRPVQFLPVQQLLVSLPLKTPSPGEVNLLQTYSPCYPQKVEKLCF